MGQCKQYYDDSDEIFNESTSSNTKTHLEFFPANLDVFGHSFYECFLCLITDSLLTNQKISTDCSQPLIIWYRYKLNLEFNRMIINTNDLNAAMEYSHYTMIDAQA